MSGDAFTAWQNALLSLYLRREDQTKTCLRFSASLYRWRGQRMSRLILARIHSYTKHALRQIGKKCFTLGCMSIKKTTTEGIYIYSKLGRNYSFNCFSKWQHCTIYTSRRSANTKESVMKPCDPNEGQLSTQPTAQLRPTKPAGPTGMSLAFINILMI